MNICNKYKIKCLYALVVWDELPCFGSEEQCKKWREKIMNDKHGTKTLNTVDIE